MVDTGLANKSDTGEIEMQTLNELMEMANKENGKARTRTIGKSEAQTILNLVENADDSVHTIRVYSDAGFVPNSYKYRCEIRYFEATRREGKFVIFANTTDAKRSRGDGSLVTINGRAA